MRTLLAGTTAVLAIIGACFTAAPTQAGDIQGDAYDCQELWVMRNQIFKNAGYCFKTDKAIDYFGNGGCVYANQDDVPLTKMDKIIIRDVLASEKRQQC